MSTSDSTAPNRRVLLWPVLGLVVVIVALAVVWFVHAARNKPIGHTADDGSDVGVLIGLGEDAYKQQHWVSPVGSNVYEFFFSVLQADPHNSTAEKRLKDAFKPACDEIEATVNKGDLDEAQRELSLLRMYDASNFRLALLGGVIDSQRVIERHKHEAEARKIQQAQEQQ